MVGETVSQYDILERIGAGGMGVVYKARDQHLGRLVALKFLPPHAIGEDDKKRFLREAQAASTLDHPNICTIYQVGETDDGETFIAMAFYDGETLREKISRGRLPIDEALDVAQQVAAGMAEAHKRGVTHRDIKPANLIVTKDGVVKIVDFGLAKLAASTKITRPGTAMGTAGYVSPEQIQGDNADQRSDIWSLGAVLYEMLTGEMPFQGDYEPALVYSVVNEEPPRVRELQPDVPPQLESIVHRALAKEPDRRFQQMEELLDQLRAVETGLSSSSEAEAAAPAVAPRKQRKQTWLAAGVGVLAAVSVLLGFLAWRGATSNTERASAVQSVSLVTPDAAELPSETAVEENTPEAAANKPAEPSDEPSRAAAPSDPEPQEPAPADAASKDRPTPPASTDESGPSAPGATSAAPPEDGSAANVEVVPPKSPAPATSEARALYAQGRSYLAKWGPEPLRRAADHFQRAIKADAHFAPAYAGLAECLGWAAFWGYQPAGTAWPQAKVTATRALKIDPSLAEAHASLASFAALYEWNWPQAEKEFRRALELNPASATTRGAYAASYLLPRRRFGAAKEEMARAKRADSSSAFQASVAMDVYLADGKDRRALLMLQKLVEERPAGVRGRLRPNPSRTSDPRSARPSASRNWNHLPGGSPSLMSAMAATMAKAGHPDRARRALERLHRMPATIPVSPFDYALLYAALGEGTKALEWLEKGYQARDSRLVMINVAPEFDALRDDSRFRALLERMNLPH